MEKIERCPFCNGKGEFHISSYDGYSESRIWYFNIRCSKCLTKQPEVYTFKVMFSKTGELKVLVDQRSKAVEDWNRRAL